MEDKFMSKFIDILGKRFGKLVAIERISDGAYGKWKFKCDCGNIKIISKQNVTQHKVNSCGCLNKDRAKENRLNLVGKKFDRLTVISLNSCNKNTLWNCHCDCGKDIIVKGSYLINRHTRSCGCMRVFRLSKGTAGFNIVYKNYKRHALDRNYEFKLSKDEFREMTQQNCFYCGTEPKSKQKNISDHSTYIYNGIDRIDNNKGYVKDNVVTSCGICNTMKLDLSLQDFLNQIDNIYKLHLKT